MIVVNCVLHCTAHHTHHGVVDIVWTSLSWEFPMLNWARTGWWTWGNCEFDSNFEIIWFDRFVTSVTLRSQLGFISLHVSVRVEQVSLSYHNVFFWQSQAAWSWQRSLVLNFYVLIFFQIADKFDFINKCFWRCIKIHNALLAKLFKPCWFCSWWWEVTFDAKQAMRELICYHFTCSLP